MCEWCIIIIIILNFNIEFVLFTIGTHQLNKLCGGQSYVAR